MLQWLPSRCVNKLERRSEVIRETRWCGKIRRKAVELLRKQHKLREVMSVCSLSDRTSARLKQSIESKDSAVLEKMLDPRAHRASRQPVLNV